MRIWSECITSFAQAGEGKPYLWAFILPLSFPLDKINNFRADNTILWAGKSHNRQLPCLIWRLIDWLSRRFDLILPDLHQKITSHHVLQAPDVTFKPLWKAQCTFTVARPNSLSLPVWWSTDSRKSERRGKKVISPRKMTHAHICTHTLTREHHTNAFTSSLIHSKNIQSLTHTQTQSRWRRREEWVRGCKRSRVLCNGGEEWVCSVRPGRHNGFVSCLI